MSISTWCVEGRYKKLAKQGRPTKFDPKKMAAVELMARRGFTDKEIARCLGVTEQTINNWKKAHPDFFESLKGWKDYADGNVERSLYERATGYTAPETKAQWVETSEVLDGQVFKSGRWEYADLRKHYPPDTPAAIFWLKNRQGWRDKQELEHSGDITLRVVYDEAKPVDPND